MGEQSLESAGGAGATENRPARAADTPAHDLRLMLGIAAVLALSLGLCDTAEFLPRSGPAELLAMFVWRTIFAFCGIAPAIVLLVVLESRLPMERRKRWTALGGAVLLAAALGSLLQVAAELTLGNDDVRRWNWGDEVKAWAWTGIISNLIVWLVLVAVWREALRRRRATLDALHESELRGVALQARLAEAELQMLQAQIEPHFHFNSLANVRRLSRLDVAAGKAMLADLLKYLQQTLPRLRDADATLAREAEVARAYLAVYKIRMGSRLDVEFAIPPELGSTPVPPMMLLTLVENALKHGLAPLPEGGRIRVAAENEGRTAVRLSVADTGRGIVPGRGAGNGLANVRARLRTMHGAKAALSLETNVPHGVIASIVLPRP